MSVLQTIDLKKYSSCSRSQEGAGRQKAGIPAAAEGAKGAAAEQAALSGSTQGGTAYITDRGGSFQRWQSN